LVGVAVALALATFAGVGSLKRAHAYDPPGNNPPGVICDHGEYPQGCAAPINLRADSSAGLTLTWGFDDQKYSHPIWFTIYKGPANGPWGAGSGEPRRVRLH